MRNTAFSDACEGTGRYGSDEQLAGSTHGVDGIYRPRRSARQSPLWGGTVVDPETAPVVRRAHPSHWPDQAL